MLSLILPPLRLLLLLATITPKAASNALHIDYATTTNTDISIDTHMPLDHRQPATNTVSITACQPTTAPTPSLELRAITTTMGNTHEKCNRQPALACTNNLASFIVPAVARTIASTTIFLEIVFNAAVAIMISDAAPPLTTWSPMDSPAALLQDIWVLPFITAASTAPAKLAAFL